MTDKPEGKKLTKEELEHALGRMGFAGFEISVEKVRSHITVLEGEVENLEKQYIEWNKATEILVDKLKEKDKAILELLNRLEEKDGEIERLHKGWEAERKKEWATASGRSERAIECHNLKSRNKALQATIENMREAVKPFKFYILDIDKDDWSISVKSKHVKDLVQACETEGESVIPQPVADDFFERNKDALRRSAVIGQCPRCQRVLPECKCHEPSPCPDCGGSGHFDCTDQDCRGYTDDDCPTCNGTGREVER